MVIILRKKDLKLVSARVEEKVHRVRVHLYFTPVLYIVEIENVFRGAV